VVWTCGERIGLRLKEEAKLRELIDAQEYGTEAQLDVLLDLLGRIKCDRGGSREFVVLLGLV